MRGWPSVKGVPGRRFRLALVRRPTLFERDESRTWERRAVEHILVSTLCRAPVPSEAADIRCTHPGRIGGAIIRLGLALSFGLDAGFVVPDLTFDRRGVPAENRCDQGRRGPGGLQTAIEGLDRDARSARQDVVEMEGAFMGGCELDLGCEVAGRALEWLAELRIPLDEVEEILDPRAVPMQ